MLPTVHIALLLPSTPPPLPTRLPRPLDSPCPQRFSPLREQQLKLIPVHSPEAPGLTPFSLLPSHTPPPIAPPPSRPAPVPLPLFPCCCSLLESNDSELIPVRCHDVLDFQSIDRQISRIAKILGMTGDDPLYDEEEEEEAKEDEDVSKAGGGGPGQGQGTTTRRGGGARGSGCQAVLASQPFARMCACHHFSMDATTAACWAPSLCLPPMCLSSPPTLSPHAPLPPVACPSTRRDARLERSPAAGLVAMHVLLPPPPTPFPHPQDKTIIELLENELLLLCGFVLKLGAVTPSKSQPLPYLVELYNNGQDTEKVRYIAERCAHGVVHLPVSVCMCVRAGAGAGACASVCLDLVNWIRVEAMGWGQAHVCWDAWRVTGYTHCSTAARHTPMRA